MKPDLKILCYLVQSYPFAIILTHYVVCYAAHNPVTAKYLSFSEQPMFYHGVLHCLHCSYTNILPAPIPSGEIVRSNVVISIQSLLGILVDFLISTVGLYYIYIWNTNTLYCICLYVKFSNKISLKSGMMESHSSSNIYYWHTMHIQYVLEEKKKIKVIQWEILLS